MSFDFPCGHSNMTIQLKLDYKPHPESASELVTSLQSLVSVIYSQS